MIKYAIDFIISAILLAMLSPLMLLIWVLISFRLERPAIFCQTRPGLNGRPFKMFKFKTMISATDDVGARLPDEERLTPLGSWLRKTSLDELPELWNVLRGEMSLVGPRPLLLEYLPRYSERQARRHEVRPGVTGWAQVNGRNAISWEEKFEFDVWYVDNHSFLLDLKILWMTVGQVLRRDGISSEGHATIPVFTGSTERDSA
jgi:lipopolysaccharide/colanic/teichoic acid biosynthesis glycosyltransferase